MHAYILQWGKFLPLSVTDVLFKKSELVWSWHPFRPFFFSFFYSVAECLKVVI